MIGKGPNTVITLIHHFLESQPPQDTLVLFADNCIGQNKNNERYVALFTMARTIR